MSNNFLEALKGRRSIYSLNDNLSLSDEEIENLVKEAVKHSPSPFNSQSSRAVILFSKAHTKLWNIVEDTLREIVPSEKFDATKEKIASFRAGYGTILFFEDAEVIKGLQEKFPTYKEKFPIWSEQTTGIAQHSVWTMLANAGIGASLQHYNPLIDEAVKKEWELPENWYLCAEMPFGNIVQPAKEKDFIDDNKRFRVFKQ